MARRLSSPIVGMPGIFFHRKIAIIFIVDVRIVVVVVISLIVKVSI